MKMTAAEFEQAVREAVDALPAPIRRALDNVAIVVQDLPEPRQWRSAGADGPMGLLGLYEGGGIDRSVFDPMPPSPDRITLFRRPLEAACATREELVEQIRATVLHEIGHHLGFDEAELDEMGMG